MRVRHVTIKSQQYDSSVATAAEKKRTTGRYSDTTLAQPRPRSVPAVQPMSKNGQLDLPAPPGLMAMVVYLRPLPRADFLAQLAELGIFVAEVPSAARVRTVARSTRPDMVILVGSDAPSDRQLARDLLATDTLVLAVLPPGTPTAPFVALGVDCLTDDDVDSDFGVRVAPAARQARQKRELRMRGNGDHADEMQIHPDPPELVYHGRSVALDEGERACMLCLLDAPGLPVASDELSRALRETRIASRESGDEDVAAVVTRLRMKMEQVGADPAQLAAVEHFGYVLLT